MLAVQDPLERVLRSKTFAASPSSRRLLKYLAERTSCDDPELKEYSIGVDVFGKSTAYDPQQDSTVRIQVGRLRQRLTAYYETEGREDPVVLDIPKGGFRLATLPNTRVPGEPPEAEVPPPAAREFPWKLTALLSLAALSAALLFLVARVAARAPTEAWNSDLEQIWQPFLASPRPLLIVFSTPLFVEMQGTMLFRDRSEEVWERAMTSERMNSVRRALGDPPVRPSHYYAAAGEVGSAFSLAKALSPRKPSISLLRDVQLSWPQLADNNVLFLGPPRFFRDRLGELPMELEILAEPDQFRVLHPQPGERASFPKEGVQGEGETFVLLTHSLGPGGKGRILSFMSNDTFARQGAVQASTDPEFARTLVARFRTGAAAFPDFYQVLLRVRVKGGVTTEIQPVLHRALTRKAAGR
jgi:hypothetical protein